MVRYDKKESNVFYFGHTDKGNLDRNNESGKKAVKVNKLPVHQMMETNPTNLMWLAWKEGK